MPQRYEGLAVCLRVVLMLSVLVVCGVGDVTAAPAIHDCTVEAPGEGCLFDLLGSGGGTLKVDTKAGTAGDRWRTTIVIVDTKTVESAVGTGSATSFTGLVQRGMVNGKRYEVLVTYELPVSGTIPDPFPPTSLEVRFAGPAVDQGHVTITGPRPQGPETAPSPLAPVAQTGQAQCRNASGTSINCAGTGQDGEFQAGVPSPTPRFTDHSNGTVTDNLTGLIWLQNANCFGGETWANALNAANTLAAGICGLTDSSQAGDWRLPNVRELQSLIDFGQFNPALPAGHPFSGVQSTNYWTSTTTASIPGGAWSLGLYDGFTAIFGKDLNFLLWPVREGL